MVTGRGCFLRIRGTRAAILANNKEGGGRTMG